jgi:hypothetical protein
MLDLASSQHTPATLSDLKTCSKEDAQERWERVVSASLSALAAFIEETSSVPAGAGSAAAKNDNELDYASVLSDRTLKLLTSDMYAAV